jgi:hypothetical protein
MATDTISNHDTGGYRAVAEWFDHGIGPCAGLMRKSTPT